MNEVVGSSGPLEPLDPFGIPVVVVVVVMGPTVVGRGVGGVGPVSSGGSDPSEVGPPVLLEPATGSSNTDGPQAIDNPKNPPATQLAPREQRPLRVPSFAANPARMSRWYVCFGVFVSNISATAEPESRFGAARGRAWRPEHGLGE